MKKSANQIMKEKFRASKVWKATRAAVMRLQDGIDPVTLQKLRKGFVCHHLLLDKDKYKDVEELENFMCLNSATHKVVHFCYEYYKKDEDFIQRLKNILDIMVELNG